MWYSWRGPQLRIHHHRHLPGQHRLHPGRLHRHRAEQPEQGCGQQQRLLRGWLGKQGDLQRQCRHTYRIVVCDAGGLRKSTFTLKLYNAASSAYTINDLGTLPGASASWGLRRQRLRPGRGRREHLRRDFPRLFVLGRSMKDHNDFILADSGWELTHAWAIITSGQIVGEGKTNGQDVRSRG